MDLTILQNESDIRGIALGEKANLTNESIKRISYGFLVWLSRKVNKEYSNLTISIGHDSRITGPSIKEEVIKTLTSYGVTVLDAKLATTPSMFYSCIFDCFKADGAIMITASHLPMDRNGFKFFTKDSGLEKEDIKEILEIANTFEPGRSVGLVKEINLMEVYSKYLQDMIKEKVGSLSGLKITVDAGNGAGGFYANDVLAPLSCDTSGSIYLDPDGTFPNHVPNPENVDAMHIISEQVKRTNSDLGLIFDTDVDRMSAVDSKGNEISRNRIVALAASLISKDYPGTTIVTDSITSNELTDYLENCLGLKHLRYKRGYRNVINKSIELNSNGINSALAIETSGHAAYIDNYFLDDGAYLATKIVIKLAELKKEGLEIDSILSSLKSPLSEKEIRLNITNPDFKSYADKALEDLLEFAKDENLEVVTPNYEGVRLNINRKNVKGWLLLRKSLHDPILPLNMETSIGSWEDIYEILKPFLSRYDGIEL